MTEYVPACYDYQVTLECAIPGHSDSAVNDGTDARRNHGLCANPATLEINGSKGYEVENGVTNYNRPITNVVIGAANNGTTGYSTNIGTHTSDMIAGYYMATWTSTDNQNNTGSYYHYGRAYVTNAIADPNRPNHS